MFMLEIVWEMESQEQTLLLKIEHKHFIFNIPSELEALTVYFKHMYV